MLALAFIIVIVFFALLVISAYLNLSNSSYFSSKIFSLHHNIEILLIWIFRTSEIEWNYFSIFSDSYCGINIVSCDHADYDSSLFADSNSLRDRLFQRIFDSCHPQNNQIFLQLLRILCLWLSLCDFFITE